MLGVIWYLLGLAGQFVVGQWGFLCFGRDRVSGVQDRVVLVWGWVRLGLGWGRVEVQACGFRVQFVVCFVRAGSSGLLTFIFYLLGSVGLFNCLFGGRGRLFGAGQSVVWILVWIFYWGFYVFVYRSWRLCLWIGGGQYFVREFNFCFLVRFFDFVGERLYRSRYYSDIWRLEYLLFCLFRGFFLRFQGRVLYIVVFIEEKLRYFR